MRGLQPAPAAQERGCCRGFDKRMRGGRACCAARAITTSTGTKLRPERGHEFRRYRHLGRQDDLLAVQQAPRGHGAQFQRAVILHQSFEARPPPPAPSRQQFLAGAQFNLQPGEAFLGCGEKRLDDGEAGAVTGPTGAPAPLAALSRA